MAGKFITTTLTEYLNVSHETGDVTIAFHGTGISFDSFSSDYIGSGIGNNGFGYGIYLTESKKSAKQWADSLEGKSTVTLDGIRASDGVNKFMTNAVKTHGNKPEILLIIIKSYSKQLLDSNEITNNEYDLIKAATLLKLVRARVLYEVEIFGSDFILWKSPITNEQIGKILTQFKLEGFGKIVQDDGQLLINDMTIRSGEDLYLSIGLSAKETSGLLSRSGIDGVVYYDTYCNYVIFDPTSLNIKKKTHF